MSQENVEVVRRLFAAAERGDISGFMSGLDPEIEWDGSRVVPDTTVARGHEAVRKAFRRWFGAWREDFETRAEEIVVLDPNTAFVVVHDLGTAKGKRHNDGPSDLPDLGVPRRTRGPHAPLPRRRPSPRSRGAGGVGRSRLEVFGGRGVGG